MALPTGKKIVRGKEARARVLEGLNANANSVKSTLGPKGRFVLIETAYNYPVLTKDGVTVSQYIAFKDPHTNLGSTLIKQAANKTSDLVGDGTTTVSVLAQAMVNEAIAYVDSGIPAIEIAEGMNKTVEAAIDFITANYVTKIDRQDYKKLLDTATVSANNDVEIGKLVADAVASSDTQGVIRVEESKNFTSYIDFIEGLSFDKGFLSPHFVNTKDHTVEYENPLFFITDQKLSNSRDIISALQLAVNAQRPLIVVADEIQADALSILILNKLKGNLKVAAIKAPAYADRRRRLLEDLAIYTGSSLFAPDLGMKIEEVTLDDLGSCEKIVMTKDSTSVFGPKGSAEDISSRIEEIRSEYRQTEASYLKEKLEERLANLTGKIAVIKVGGATELEVREKKDRIDDALHATRAAILEGVVAGGGTTLYRASKFVFPPLSSKEGSIYGYKAVTKAMQAPFKTIMENAGKDVTQEEFVLLNKLGETASGLDVATNEWKEDLVEAGIIDPFAVLSTSLRAAASVANQLLMTEVVITIEPEQKIDLTHPHTQRVEGYSPDQL